MPRAVHFEIHADKPERAVAFYTEGNIFGMFRSDERAR